MPTHTENSPRPRRKCTCALWRVCDKLRRVCVVCGTPLTVRPQQKCCSAKCRAALSRLRRVPLPLAEAREFRAWLTTILETAWDIKATLERYSR